MNKLKKLGCILVAATFVGSFQVLAKASKSTPNKPYCHEYYNIEDAREANKMLDGEIAGYKIVSGEKESDEPSISKQENEDCNKLRVGCYVNVTGRGNESSDGSGNMGYTWKNKKMMIVGVRENNEYPYACAIVDEDPSVEDVMAWFKADNLDYLTGQKLYSVTMHALEKITVDSNGNEIITYYAPEGYSLNGDKAYKTGTIKTGPIYSDLDEKTISKIYSIPLTK